MNYFPFHIGEPWQSQLETAFLQRDASKTSKDRSRANSKIRSIRLAAARAKGTHTEAQWISFVSAFGCRCVICGESMQSNEIQKDHIIPIYQGGSDGIENLQPLCGPCNASKGPDRTNWAEYRMERGFD